MDNSSVSILIPFKNTAEFLPDCIQSIIGQTYKDWEILAVNDHATDNSPNIMNAYAQKDARIKVLKNDGKGII